MDQQQYKQLKSQLTELTIQTEREDIALMAQALLKSLPEDISSLPVSNNSIFKTIVNRLKSIETHYFSQTIMRRILSAFFLISGASTLLLVVFIGSILANPEYLEEFILSSIVQSETLVNNPISLNWYLAWIVITIVVGILYLIAFASFILRNDQQATRLGTIGLTIALTIGNTLSFYFNQFSVMLTSIALFGFLLAIIRYRIRFLQDN